VRGPSASRPCANDDEWLRACRCSSDTAGENEGCVSEDGVHDMMGNVHDTPNNGDGCEYDTEAHNTSHCDDSTGFRCCAD
jgi:hypothetical protein